MKINEYQEWAKAKMNGIYNSDKSLLVAGLGLTGEAGEVANDIKKLYYGRFTVEETREKLLLELGDCLWYMAAVATNQGFTLDDVVDANIVKLEDRWARKANAELNACAAASAHKTPAGAQ